MRMHSPASWRPSRLWKSLLWMSNFGLINFTMVFCNNEQLLLILLDFIWIWNLPSYTCTLKIQLWVKWLHTSERSLRARSSSTRLVRPTKAKLSIWTRPHREAETRWRFVRPRRAKWRRPKRGTLFPLMFRTYKVGYWRWKRAHIVHSVSFQ